MQSSPTPDGAGAANGGKRVCLFTGAGGKLGGAFCRLYARDYEIVAVYRSGQLGLPSQRERFIDPLDPNATLPENAHPVYALKADLDRDDDLEWLVEVALARYGRIDLLVNAAASMFPAEWTDDALLSDHFESQMRINALLPIKLAAIVARKFWRQRAAENSAHNRNVVNVSSTSALHVIQRPRHGLYGASKAALNFLSLYQAQEFRRFGVRVNVTAPTSFPDLIPTERAAASIVALDRGGETGQVLVVNGDGHSVA